VFAADTRLLAATCRGLGGQPEVGLVWLVDRTVLPVAETSVPTIAMAMAMAMAMASQGEADLDHQIAELGQSQGSRADRQPRGSEQRGGLGGDPAAAPSGGRAGWGNHPQAGRWAGTRSDRALAADGPPKYVRRRNL